MQEILDHYKALVGMKGRVHPDWVLWLNNEILSLETAMEDEHAA